MNKCTKCGTEFEGKFCPECGTPANSKPTCPRCGNEVNPTARFCANCGCDLSQPNAQEQQAVQTSAPVQTVQDASRQGEKTINWRKLLRYLPMALFALWAVLLWAFYASNVINGDGFLTDATNLYQLLKDEMMVDMFATSRTLIAFAVIADVYAVVLGWMSFKARGLVGKIVTYASFAFHLVIIICAGVLSGQCKQFTEGFEELNGNFAAVVISLTVVFAVLQAAALVLDKFFGEHEAESEAAQSQKERKPKETPKFIVNTGKWLRAHRVLAIIVAVTLVATVVLSTVLPITLGNIFRISKVEKINLGDTTEQVQKVLGKPYEGTSNDSTYQYYSKNAVKILDQLEDLSKQAENLTSFDKLDQLLTQEEKLEEQLKLLDYEQITVDFYDGKVSGLLLDTHVGKLDAKQIKNIYLGDKSGGIGKKYKVDLLDVVNGTVAERIEFSDGSYSLDILPRNLTISGGRVDSGFPVSGTISWTNDFGAQSKTVDFDSSNIDFSYTVSSNQLSLDGTILTKSFYEMFGMELPWANEKITSVYFGDKVEYIPDISQLLNDASQLETVEVDSSNANYTSQKGILFSKDMSQLLYVPAKNDSLLSTDWYNYQSNGLICDGNTLWTYKGVVPRNYKLTVPEGVTEIKSNAFANQTNLTAVTIPSSVTSIGDSAFSGCEGLQTVTFASDSQLQSIGESAFSGCSSLQAVTFAGDSKLQSIGESAFEDCFSLTSFTIPSSVTSISRYAFSDCRSLVIYCEMAEKPSGWDSSWNSSSRPVVWNCLENDVATDGYIYITVNNVKYALKDDEATVTHNNCSGSITIPSQVEYKGKQYPVTAIGRSAFSGCDSLTSITIPSSVTYIGGYAFQNCSCLIIYCEVEKRPSGWDSDWNYSSCPVVWSCSDNDVANDGYIYTVVNNVRYALKDDEATVVRNSCSGSITILSQVEYKGKQYPVTTITQSAFENCSRLTSVTISSNITSIEYGAFINCTSLQIVTFGDDSQLQSIGSSAFYGCSNLTSITIPSGITSIDSSAFDGCDRLQYNVLDGVNYLGNDENNYLVLIGVVDNTQSTYKLHESIKIISGYAFYRCDSLTSIIIPSSVTSIGAYAFRGCESLQKVTFDDDSQLQSIGSYAFQECSSLTSITIPSSVTSIGGSAFDRCSRLIIYCEVAEKPSDWDRYWNEDKRPVVWNCLENEVADDGYIYTIVNNVRYGLKDDEATVARNNYSGSITIPSQVEYKGKQYSVTAIGVSAFSGCDSLTSITIPSSVTSIGSSAFSGCSSLQYYVADGVNYLGNDNDKYMVLMGVVDKSQTTYKIHQSTKIIYDSAFKDCDSLTSITIPSGVTSIGRYAFSVCSSLQTVKFDGDSQLQSIGEDAFWYCSSLTSITIPSGVTSIGESAFEDCRSLTSLNIPSSVTSIGAYAFRDCRCLTIYCEVAEKPSGWSNSWNFSSCPVVWNCLENEVADDGYIYIIVNNFRYGLKDNEATVARYNYSGSITILSQVEYKGKKYSVTAIGKSAFSGCDSLTSITIPSSVTSIGSNAFYGCSNLTSATFENPDGWRAGNTFLGLNDPAQNAKYLIRYSSYIWTRS